jgi:hypothetical protein
MSLDECENAYLHLSKQIFTPRRHKSNFWGQGKDFILADGKFDGEVLATAIKQVISEVADEDILLKDPSSPCKVYVEHRLVIQDG